MYQIDKTTEHSLRAAEAVWFNECWFGRSVNEVLAFQDRWLAARGMPHPVQGPTGLVWGSED